MKTLGEVLQLAAKFLKEKGVDRSRRQAEELLSHLLKISRVDLYMQFDRLMEEKELEIYRGYIQRKVKGEPWQYIVGEVDFYHCKLEVSPSVLIPRQETEILLSKIVERLPERPLEVWDLCCGSGALGIGLKKARPQDKVVLSDVSKEALAVAKKNAERNGIEVELMQGDLLEPFGARKTDVVICNPPYVTEEEWKGLEAEVKDFEPKLALVGGTTFYERLARDLPRYLNVPGKAFFELGTGMGERVLKLFTYGKASFEPDWAGHDRFFFLDVE